MDQSLLVQHQPSIKNFDYLLIVQKNLDFTTYLVYISKQNSRKKLMEKEQI